MSLSREPGILGYGTAPPSRSATGAVLALTFTLLGALVAFLVLRGHQLSLPDPYNNPYTDMSTACLLMIPGVWVCDLILLVTFRGRISRGVGIFGGVVVGLFGVLILLFLVGMLMFVF